MNLVTGKKSQDHITSDDFRKMIESLVGGGGSYVTSVGDELETTISGTNLYIGKGMIIHRGCVYETSNSGDTVAFQPGQSGMNRIDLVCVHYTRNNTTGIENAVWQVIQGTSTSGTPTAPSVPSGDLREDSATDDYCAVFKITHTGTSPSVALLLQDIPMDGAYHKPASGIPKTDLAFNPIQMDLLWTNPDPSQIWEAGTPQAVNLSGYDRVRIDFKSSNSDSAVHNSIVSAECKIGESSSVMGMLYTGDYSPYMKVFLPIRLFSVTSSAVNFSYAGCFHSIYGAMTDGYSITNYDNNYCIPLRIYGIKGVS